MRHTPTSGARVAAPSRATMRGFQAIALSSRCQTNQFSTQPAISELANSSTPVKAAKNGVGPEQRQRIEHVRPLVPVRPAARRTARASHCAASTSGDHGEHVAEDAGRLRAHQVRDLVDEALDRVVAGDVVELVGHGRRGHRRLLGGDREVQQLDQRRRGRVVHAGREPAPERAERDRAERELERSVVAPSTAPPPAAVRSIARYSARSRVM